MINHDYANMTAKEFRKLAISSEKRLFEDEDEISFEKALIVEEVRKAIEFCRNELYIAASVGETTINWCLSNRPTPYIRIRESTMYTIKTQVIDHFIDAGFVVTSNSTGFTVSFKNKAKEDIYYR